MRPGRWMLAALVALTLGVLLGLPLAAECLLLLAPEPRPAALVATVTAAADFAGFAVRTVRGFGAWKATVSQGKLSHQIQDKISCFSHLSPVDAVKPA